MHIVVADVFGEAVVGLLFLHGKHLRHLAICHTELEFPMYETPIYLDPVFPSAAIHNLHCNLLKLLLVARLSNLGDYLLAVDVLLQREENLVGVDRLDEIIGYLRAYGLVHNVLLLTLHDHHDWHGRSDLLYALKRLEPVDTRHHLVEKDKVETCFAALLNGIIPIGDSYHIVSFLFQKQYVGTEKFYLVICP